MGVGESVQMVAAMQKVVGEAGNTLQYISYELFQKAWGGQRNASGMLSGHGSPPEDK